MAAANEAGEGEVVLALSMLLLVAAIQDFLAAISSRSADQRLVTSLIADLASVLDLPLSNRLRSSGKGSTYQFTRRFASF